MNFPDMSRREELSVIKCLSKEIPFATDFTNGKHTGRSDAPKEKGGGDTGLNPHELLEAALGCCLNIWLRVYAQQQDIPLEHVTATVTLDHQNPAEAVFQYAFEFKGSLSEAQRQALLQAAHLCPVHQALSGKISFQGMSA
jgi:putative redox protein